MRSLAEHLADGLRHHQRGAYGTAAACYQAALTVDPDHVQALYLSGLVGLAEGRPDAARDHLERALARQGRRDGMAALLFVDLDDFKRVNDTYGHAVGDQILVQVAQRLVGAVRAEDVVARQSGDEFAVLLVEVGDRDETIHTAERLLRELRRPILLGGRSVVVGGSVGIALAAEQDATLEDVVTQADAAMYAAKAAGKDRYAVYEQQMPSRTWTELEAAG